MIIKDYIVSYTVDYNYIHGIVRRKGTKKEHGFLVAGNVVTIEFPNMPKYLLEGLQERFL